MRKLAFLNFSRLMVLFLALVLPSAATAEQPDYARIFQGRDACFLLYDMKTDTLAAHYNDSRCAERVSPCSTFKVPLSLMAFDAGLLKDESTVIRWDGTTYSRDAWNRDQTSRSWMADSVVWVSQRLTAQLGMKRVKRYLAGLDFGNRDMSGGLTRAWLMSSLEVSPEEELRFWRKLWRDQLPVSKHALELTKKITLIGTSPAGWTLHGKTGSGSIGETSPNDDTGLQLGWFVGHVARGDREYVFATNFADRERGVTSGPAGWTARDITKTILGQLGLY